MNSSSSIMSSGPAILVISCSDARLTRENAQLTWKKRLSFSGDIFEFKCPGGGVAMADRKSSFYRSAFESFRLLSGSRRISQVVLAFHEQCAYVSDKYVSGTVAAAEVEELKWTLANEAVDNVLEWAEGLRVKPLYTRFMLNREAEHSTEEVYRREDRDHHHAGHSHPHSHSARQPDRPRNECRFVPSERVTLRSFERQVEERLLRTNESVDQIIALAEGQARETGTMPAWRIEIRAREFIDLLHRNGRTKAQALRKPLIAFVQSYAGDSIPRGVQRSILAELDLYLQSLQSGTRSS